MKKKILHQYRTVCPGCKEAFVSIRTFGNFCSMACLKGETLRKIENSSRTSVFPTWLLAGPGSLPNASDIRVQRGCDEAFLCEVAGRIGVTWRFLFMCLVGELVGMPKNKKARACLHCGRIFYQDSISKRRTTCSAKCSMLHTRHSYRVVDRLFKTLAKPKLKKNPYSQNEYNQKLRSLKLQLLGGCCVVCGADNPNWLEIDYIPTSRGQTYRHATSYGYLATHLQEFRILCANHHRELTVTGRIKGTDILQPRGNKRNKYIPIEQESRQESYMIG